MKHIFHLLVATATCSMIALSAHAQTASSSVSSKATITEFPTPSTFSLPQGPDIASDGSLWYAESNAGKIAVLHPNRTTTEYSLPAGGQPVTIKIGADGIWFTDGTNHAIGLLNPATGSIQEHIIPSGAAPLFLQLASDGSKWFTEPTGVGRLAPTGVITEWDVTLEHPDDNIEQLSIDPFGNIWFAERNFDGAGAAGTNKVRRLNPLTNVISTFRVPTFGGNPAGIHANADGTVWVSEYFANSFALLVPSLAPHTTEIVSPSARTASSSAITVRPSTPAATPGTRTNAAPATSVVRPSLSLGWIEYPIPTANIQSEDMRVDKLGRLWFEGDSGFLGVLSPLTASFTIYNIPSASAGYFDIALDPTGQNLWFTEAGIFASGIPTRVGVLNVAQ